MRLKQARIHRQLQWGFQSTQAFLRVELTWDQWPTVIHQDIDQHLKKSFDLISFDLYIACSHETAQADSVLIFYLSRFTRLAQVLVHDLKVPSLAPPILIDYECASNEDHRQLKVQLGIPWLEHIPTELLSSALVMAYRGFSYMLRSEGFEEYRDQYFNELQKQFYEYWAQRIPGGKSTLPLLIAAHPSQPISHLGMGIYQIGLGISRQRIDRSASSLENPIAAQLASHKHYTSEALRRAGLPVPMQELVRDWPSALQATKKITYPVVVKPVSGERGEGVTTGITNDVSLKIAFKKAREYGLLVVIEPHIPGTCHRIAIYQNQFLYASMRHPRSLLGDGVHKVSELLNIENQKILCLSPPKRLPLYPQDDLATQTLSTAGYSWNDCPPPGIRIPLRPLQSTEWGGSPEDVSEFIHPENIELAQRAAKILGLQLAGVDLISTDIRRPYYENGACINEVNYAPVLGRTHAFQRRGVEHYMRGLMGQRRSPEIHLYLGSEAFIHWYAQYEQRQARQIWLCDSANHHAADSKLAHVDNRHQTIIQCAAHDFWDRLICWHDSFEQAHLLQDQPLKDHVCLGWVTHIHLCEHNPQAIIAWENYCQKHYRATIIKVISVQPNSVT